MIADREDDTGDGLDWYAEPPGDGKPTLTTEPWQILIVDDDPSVHAMTRLCLGTFSFDQRPIALVHSASGIEARRVLESNAKIAVVLLDVVMEAEDAGLSLVRYIRQEIRNRAVRIILITGQPGSAPARSVLVNFDINDYRAKSELTQDRLLMCVIVALRSYRDYRLLETGNEVLHRIAQSAEGMFRANALPPLLHHLLTQLVAITAGTGDIALCARQVDPRSLEPETTVVLGLGSYEGGIGRALARVLADDETVAVEHAITTQCHDFSADRIILAVNFPERWSGAVLIRVGAPPAENLKVIIDIFIAMMIAAIDNVFMLEELRLSNKATVVALADLAEHRDTDTGAHVLRVAMLCGEIARELQRRGNSEVADPMSVEHIALAGMLHDVGKVGIPDHILKKPGRLELEERHVMETHSALGGKAMDQARRLMPTSRLLTLGWEIAFAHHEAYDGSGYPQGLKGDSIPLAARIASVADVFDALTSKRPYKSAWPVQEALDFITASRGTKFDPDVVDAFLAVILGRQSNPAFPWTEKLCLGDERFDADHQLLLSLLNKLSAANTDNDYATVRFTIDELIRQILLHFDHEESVMVAAGYPYLTAHHSTHGILSRQIAALRTRYFNGMSGRLNADILDFLGQWLIHHIDEQDRHFVTYLKEMVAL